MKYNITGLILLFSILFLMFVQVVTDLTILDKLTDIENDIISIANQSGN